jgi:hypothetical protein
MTGTTEINSLREEISAFIGFNAPQKVPATRTLRQSVSTDGDTIAASLLLPHESGPFWEIGTLRRR